MANDKNYHKSKQIKNGKVAGEVYLRPGEFLSASLPSPLEELMRRGYFPLWRKIEDWGWWKNGNTMRVFLQLLLRANFKPGDYLGHKIDTGQVVTGRKSLSVLLGLTERQVRTALSHLKATNEITIKNCNKFSIITIIKYKEYLIAPSEKSGRSPAEVRQPTTSNNDNNDKNDNNRYIRGKPQPTPFKQPSLEEVEGYCVANKYNVSAARFIDFYTSKGWMIGKNKMKDWQAAVRTWARNKKPAYQPPKEPEPIRPEITSEQATQVRKEVKGLINKILEE